MLPGFSLPQFCVTLPRLWMQGDAYHEKTGYRTLAVMVGVLRSGRRLLEIFPAILMHYGKSLAEQCHLTSVTTSKPSAVRGSQTPTRRLCRL